MLRTDAVARELCSHLYETPPLGLALHVAPSTPNTETEAGERREGWDYGPLQLDGPTPISGQGCLSPSFVLTEVPGIPQLWPARP